MWKNGYFWAMWPFNKKTNETPAGFRLYLSCEELPLYLFRKCVETGDLTPLVISGRPPVEAVADAWMKIFSEYIDLSGDNDVKAMALLKRDYILLHDKISKTEQALNILEMKVCTAEQYPQLIQIIKDEGFTFLKDHETDESFQHSIKRVRNRLAPLRLKRSGMESELLEYESATDKNELPENYFLSWLVTLQKHGFRDYNAANKALTVTEFVLAIKDYLRFVSEHNKQLNYGKEKHDQ